MTEDPDIQHRIHTLIEEEHRLRESLGRAEMSAGEEHERLRRVEVELDQCWDLLRQRRARREYGRDPGSAEVRPEGTVEGYLG
jgi:predicted nuclease with TOPRIM domain